MNNCELDELVQRVKSNLIVYSISSRMISKAIYNHSARLEGTIDVKNKVKISTSPCFSHQ